MLWQWAAECSARGPAALLGSGGRSSAQVHESLGAWERAMHE